MRTASWLGSGAQVVQRIDELYPVRKDDDAFAEAYIAVKPIGMLYRNGFRQRMPDDLTGGREMYAVHIWVFHADTPRPLSAGDGGIALPCRVIWDEPESMICTRPRRLAAPRRPVN